MNVDINFLFKICTYILMTISFARYLKNGLQQKKESSFAYLISFQLAVMLIIFVINGMFFLLFGTNQILNATFLIMYIILALESSFIAAVSHVKRYGMEITMQLIFLTVVDFIVIIILYKNM